MGHYGLTDAEWKAIEPHSPLITLGSGRDSALDPRTAPLDLGIEKKTAGLPWRL